MAALPQLRQELDLLPGPALANGSPSWTLHDPVRNLFFQLDWPSVEILRRWHMDDAQTIVADIAQHSTLRLDATEVAVLADFLRQNQLVQIAPGGAGQLGRRLHEQRRDKLRWLLHNYLFFRLPLLRPDAWLDRWSPRVAFFYSPLFLRLTLLAAGLGLISVYRHWEHFSTTLVDMLSWEGMVAYGLTLVAVKILHELGHGFTAKRYGCRVPTMGVAFLVLWPVAYTDTNEVWRLTQRNQRLAVAAAGILTELAIAAWATLAWAALPEGGPRTVAFLLSTTTWISTLAINASPFMRFDGYFLLADGLGLPNLHGRAFALARWDLRERLFQLREPPPEHFPPHRARGLIFFAWATWIYRLVLFLGIAALVYHFFIKAVGILLFLVEIGWFVLLPCWREMQAWRTRWPQLKGSGRARRSALMATIALVLFALPWPSRVSSMGLLQPREQWPIYSPEQAQVIAFPYANGAAVPAGAVLLELQSPQLEVRAARSEARREQLARQSGSAGFDNETVRDWQVLHEQLHTAEADQRAVAAEASRYTPRAPYAGILRDRPPDLQVGDWLGNRELLGRLVKPGPRQVTTYVDDEAVARIAVGDRALFSAEGGAGPHLGLRVARIDQDASRVLGEAELSTLFGGPILVRERQGLLYPERAVYRVQFDVESPTPDEQHSWRGQVTIAGRWEAPGLRFLRSALSLLWREAGF